MMRNLAAMATYANKHRLKLRPHTKTHKLIEVARTQIELGACGLTVSTTAEAVTMADICGDILLAYPVTDPDQIGVLADLAGQITLRVAIDSSELANRLSSAAKAKGNTLHILIELDVGTHRTGTQSPQQCVDLAKQVAGLPGLALDGIMIYPGHVPGPRSLQQPEALRSINTTLQDTIHLWRQHGLELSIISGGSTPTALQSHMITGLTEVRPGTYVFNDLNGVHAGVATLDDCAASIKTTVVSDAVSGQVVIDAGSKALTSDLCYPAPDSGHGYVREYPQSIIRTVYEEHGLVDITLCDEAPRVGDILTIIPNHICPCINLQTHVWLNEDEGTDALPVPQRVEARR